MQRLDRTVFKAQTAKEAEKSDALVYRQMSWQQRLRVANYLNSIAFNYPENNPPKMDKTFFCIKKR
ncbi:hypothetical protein [uncultured Pedobacter sp.]|uniref:hypothetical protein n=1 Tax=uncultured Pedobacter sp. TaxID=246139 RepID=UPI00261D4AF9|nr:hypothetical protein [uncultured Pedobacter sp.]